MAEEVIRALVEDAARSSTRLDRIYGCVRVMESRVRDSTDVVNCDDRSYNRDDMRIILDLAGRNGGWAWRAFARAFIRAVQAGFLDDAAYTADRISASLFERVVNPLGLTREQYEWHVYCLVR